MRSACTTEFSCCCIKFAFFSCPKNAFSLLLQHGFNWQQNILKLWFLALWLWFLFPTDLSHDATTLLLITLYHIYMDMHACMYVYSTQPDINIVSVNLYKDKLCKADKFSEPFQTSNMKRFMKTVKNWNPLTIFAEKVWRRHLSGFWICLCFKIQHKGRCWMNIFLIKQKLEIKKLYLLYFNLLRRFQSMEKYQ